MALSAILKENRKRRRLGRQKRTMSKSGWTQNEQKRVDIDAAAKPSGTGFEKRKKKESGTRTGDLLEERLHACSYLVDAYLS